MSAQSDAVQKLATSMEQIAKWDVLLESVFDEDQVSRVRDQMGASVAPVPVV